MKRTRWAVAAVLVLVTGACRVDGTGEVRRDGEPDSLRGTLLVSAASSLTNAFQEIAGTFEEMHPGVDVVLNVGGSASLEAQTLEGAPIDVVALASPAIMQRLADQDLLAGTPAEFAGNELVIAVPVGNPAAVSGPEHFADASLRLGLCARGVPCGDLAHALFEEADVVPRPDTEEAGVRALLTRIELGELDAGVVYRTDVLAARQRVTGVEIGRAGPQARYSIGVLAAAPNRAAAEAFVRLVRSRRGTAILVSHGFLAP